VQLSASVSQTPQQQSQQSQQQQQPAQPQQQTSQSQQHTSTTGTTVQQQQQQQHSTTPVQQVVNAPAAVLDRQVPIQITLPPQAGVPDGPQRILSIQVPASTLQGISLEHSLTNVVKNKCSVFFLYNLIIKRLYIYIYFSFFFTGNQLQTILTGPIISAAMGLPANLASTLLQQHVNSTLQGQTTLAPLQVNQPIQVVTQSTNSIVTQRPPQNQVK